MNSIYKKYLIYRLRKMMTIILSNNEIQAKITEIDLLDRSIKYTLKLSCDVQDMEKIKGYLLSVYQAYSIEYRYNMGMLEIFIFIEEFEDIPFSLKESLNQYQLLLGYDKNGDNLICDMKKTCHIIISGLSGTGKSCCVRMMVEQLEYSKANVIVLNGYREDYPKFKGRFIIGEDIKDFLDNLYNNLYYHKIPLYLVVEEMQTLQDKAISELLKKLLSIGRHYNIFIIGVIQEATKENCKFKSLFNARCTFRQIDTSSIQVVLGCNIENKLRKREFALFTDDLYYGKTFIIR